ncbi:zinc ribbon domain-containing protein [Paenibacillus rhizoplanae]
MHASVPAAGAVCKTPPEAENEVCHSCGKAVIPGAKFCPHCGEGLILKCAGCGHEMKPGQKFCPECGTRAANR